MPDRPLLVIQVPSGSMLERQLASDPPASVADGSAVVQSAPTDAAGNLESIIGGEVVMSLPSPEALREGDVAHVIRGAGPGSEPVVVVIEAAEELREQELAPLLAAARTARAISSCASCARAENCA